jgi:Domain of unknown function (DUF4157)
MRITEPNDIFEREADTVADQVMRMASLPSIGSAPALVQRKCACGGMVGQSGECEGCRNERLQQKGKIGAEIQTRSQVPPTVHEVLRSPGQPLDATTRASMEPRFGYDFGHVRIHSNEVAGQSAQEVNAQAYTVGKDIVFGSGRFAPETPDGMRLLSHELAHVIQQSDDATTTLQRQPAAPAGTAEKSEEKTGASEVAAITGHEEEDELSPIRQKLFELFGKFEKSVIGDEVFDKVETQKAWDQQKKEEEAATVVYEEEKKNYANKMKAWEEGGKKGEKPKPPIPVAKFTTCIATQQVLLTAAFKETGLAIKKEGKLPKYAFATQGAQIAEAIAPADAAGPGAWHWGRMGLPASERPKRGDIIVMAFRGGRVDQGAKELNYILNIKYGTAQKRKSNAEAQAKLKTSEAAIVSAEKSLKALQQSEKPVAGWQMREAQSSLERAVNALNAAKKAADKAASDVENLKQPTAEERAPAEAKLEAARQESAAARAERLKEPVGSKKRYLFQFSHVGFLKEKIEDLKDGTGRERWTTFDGGQLVERQGKKIEGAQASTRYYDPKSNEISGELQQGGEARWLYGWVDVDKLVVGK